MIQFRQENGIGSFVLEHHGVRSFVLALRSNAEMKDLTPFKLCHPRKNAKMQDLTPKS